VATVFAAPACKTFEKVNFPAGETALAAPAPPPEKVAEPQRVEVKGNEIVINEKIQFEVNRAVIRPESSGLLDDIAKTIKDNPSIKKIEIQGHASAEGDAKRNTKLSDDRAKAVMAAIVKRGVAKTVLGARGYGSTQPIADNESNEGRERNRRVEFKITDREASAKDAKDAKDAKGAKQ
jgi:outer membrane protein OmpA-like peptidoglycan-associated protein